MSIIISPQGGMGNRLRAIVSAIAIARITCRNIYHIWISVSGNSPFPYVKAMQTISLETLFSKSIPKCPDDIIPDICFSEWLSGDYWYQYQSSGQKLFNFKNIIRINDNADSIIKYIIDNPKSNIMIETSLSMKMSGVHENIWQNSIRTIYSAFVPNKKYLDISLKVPNVDYGISIRRGEFLSYFPEANQSFDDIYSWLMFIDNFVLFSDDYDFKNNIKNKLLQSGKIIYDIDRDNLEPWEQGFVEFIVLAHRCNKIFGTPSSSFAIEASKYGGKTYGTISTI